MNNFFELGKQIYTKAIAAVDPYNLILEHLKIQDQHMWIRGKKLYNLDKIENIYVIGMGKGTAPMAAAIEACLRDNIKKGAVIVKYGHTENLNIIDQYEAGHPVPDQNTLKFTEPLLEIAKEASENDLVIVLITGGGSALLESLPHPIGLEDLADTSRLLLGCGAAIQEINTIRKHISNVKGGRLAQHIWPAKALSLILSDVIGDPLESIASGPTSPDTTTFTHAMDIVQKYNLENTLPKTVFNHLNEGLNTKIEDTPKAGEALFKNITNVIIGNNQLALECVQGTAKENGFKPLIVTDQVQGEAREIAKMISGMIKSTDASGFPIEKPACLIFGGEPTVTIKGDGLGGRNQEIVLAMLDELKDFAGLFYFCSVGTDGTDGPTDAAGAWISNTTNEQVSIKKLKALDYLNNNDAYHFFEDIGQLIKTGPTRTNVMDLMFCLIK